MILNGWKEIAAYLKVHEGTAIEWYKYEEMPVAKVKGAMLTTSELIEIWIVKRLPPKKEAP